jgi:lipopolysaccharide transport system ATP-binding protein
MALAIAVENLGKSYRIGESVNSGICSYRTLREEIVNWAKRPLRWISGGNRHATSEPFWALKDAAFDVQIGEIIGVIGRNGAGKSTLLKLLSRITKPTAGTARLRGRVGSLLEVGTGFHPELTGRENIFLNGATLGMRRHEIARKFDQIVDFAEVEQFLDTPVKRYSSGMYVRLAFAVAAFLEPETLIIDEVLAVGDIGFQRKCLGRMREVGQSGRTVLFVSHNMAAVESLCTRALLLDSGRIVGNGDVRSLVNEYQQRVTASLFDGGKAVAEMGGPNRQRRIFRSLQLLDAENRVTQSVRMGGRVKFVIGMNAPQAIDSPTIVIGFDDMYGYRLLTVITPLSIPVLTRLQGQVELECAIDQLPLAPGDYWIKLGLRDPGEDIDQLEQVMRINVTDCDAFGEGRGFHRGICVSPAAWRVM